MYKKQIGNYLIDTIWEETQKRANNLNICEPKNNELFIDLDSSEAVENFFYKRDMINNFLEHPVYTEISVSKTPGHYHAKIEWPEDVTSAERLFLQLLLGSDPIREWCSFVKLKLRHPKPTVFYEKKI